MSSTRRTSTGTTTAWRGPAVARGGDLRTARRRVLTNGHLRWALLQSLTTWWISASRRSS
ncbi:MAG: hypothetical protein MZV70_29630 [Desulfobacterales bacterium]|nr:hypothetical protein [Desulfobacterales bacterium]